MEKLIINALTEFGPLGIMLAWTNFMFWKFLKKYITNGETQTKVIGENSEVIRQNTNMMKEFKEVMLSLKKETIP